jgi:hypothetical protein
MRARIGRLAIFGARLLDFRLDSKYALSKQKHMFIKELKVFVGILMLNLSFTQRTIA